MSKMDTQNLDGIIKKIHKNITASFLIILFSFVIVASIIFVNYRNSENELLSQKLNTTFLSFTSKVAQKLIAITMLDIFRDYLHSGMLGRKHHYLSLLTKILDFDLNIVAGMEISDNHAVEIFSYGMKTNDSVTLNLCYLNRRTLNFDVGNCVYTWKVYFKHDVIVEELKKLNPELIDCNNCSKKIITGQHFGDFPVSQFSNMQVNLTIKNPPSMVLWEIIFFIISILLILVVWNVNRIKSVFKKYLSDPIVDITSRIKENKILPHLAVEELSYLVEQIDQWKKQVVELEKIKANEKAKEEQVRIMQSIGASVAHELRTPLRSIVSGVLGIEKFLPLLLRGYNLAYEAGLLSEVIRPQQVELLQKVLINLKKEGASANTIIDMLLMKIRGTITETTGMRQIIDIAGCVNEALQRFVFQGAEKGLVSCNLTNDFQFEGDKILVVHILFNLLKNALYYITNARKGQIYIYLKKEVDENRLYFKDTGKGIAKEVLPNIFNRFYSKTEGGAGIGLSFCKMAMEWMGGDITCQSIEGEYAEFILHFPLLKE